MTHGQTQMTRHRSLRPGQWRPADRTAVGGALLLVAWLVITMASTVSIGFLNPRTITGLLVALLAVLAALALGRGRPLAVAPGVDSAVALAAGVSVMYLPMYTYLPAGDLGWLTVVMAISAGALAARELVVATGAARLAWLAGAGGALGGLLAVIALDPAPRIDVWVMLQQSAVGLVHLQNFYTMHWVGSPGWQSNYPYLPVTTVVLAPFRWVFGDVRVGLVACIAVSAVLLARPWRTRPAPRPLAALLLLAPGSIGLIEQSWSEPVLLVFLVGMFLAVERGRPALGAACYALALAAKQHVVVLIPLLAAWPKLGPKRTALGVAGAVVICLPWFAADPSAFIDGVYRLHADAPARPDAPELYSLALQHGWTPPTVLLLAVLAAVLAAACWSAHRTPRTGHVCVLAALALLVASLLNKQSFYNQYWLVAELLVVGLCFDSALDTEGFVHARTPR